MTDLKGTALLIAVALGLIATSLLVMPPKATDSPEQYRAEPADDRSVVIAVTPADGLGAGDDAAPEGVRGLELIEQSLEAGFPLFDDEYPTGDTQFSFGVDVDADDPYATDPSLEPVRPLHLGEPVDADDVEALIATTPDVAIKRHIGAVVDADIPENQMDYYGSEPRPILDIGPDVDADDPYAAGLFDDLPPKVFGPPVDAEPSDAAL